MQLDETFDISALPLELYDKKKLSDPGRFNSGFLYSGAARSLEELRGAVDRQLLSRKPGLMIFDQCNGNALRTCLFLASSSFVRPAPPRPFGCAMMSKVVAARVAGSYCMP